MGQLIRPFQVRLLHFFHLGFRQRAGQAGTKEFTDSVYGYSLRLPSDWKPYPRRSSKGEPPLRLSLSTPSKNMLIVSVKRLPGPVANHSAFERIARTYVDPVVAAYLKAFKNAGFG